MAIILIIAGAVGIGTAGYHYEPGFQRRIDMTLMVFKGDYDSIDRASAHRLPIWETASRMALDNPLNGVGVKGFMFSYHKYAAPDDPFKAKGASHPHLFLLEVLAETGTVGLLAMLFSVALVFKLGAENLKKWSPLQAGSAITLAITFFPLNAHVTLYGSNYSQVAWLMAAISIAWLYGSDEAEPFNK